jgi:internalin A
MTLEGINPCMKVSKRDSIFISYSHKDLRWLQTLQIMLRPLCRQGLIRCWSDRSINPGAHWKAQIETELSRARVAVLLVSPDFLASDFIADNELPPLLDASEEDGAVIFWIPISASLYEETRLKDYQSVIDPSRPLDSLTLPKRNQAVVQIARQIKHALNRSAFAL